MNASLIIGLIYLVPSFVLFILAALIGSKYLVQQKRCTEKTIGTVVGYTFASYGSTRYGEHLPIVRYEVGGRSYKVKGPMYTVVSVTRTSPFSSGPSGKELRGENDDQVLHSDVQLNGVIRHLPPATQSMYDRFPKGSNIDVYYDPTRPKLAYVLRYYNGKWLFWLFFGLGVFIALLSLFFIFAGLFM